MVEEIPDGDDISRHIDFPHKYNDAKELLWPNAFMFSSGAGESVVWRRYKPTINDVHELACERQLLKREQKPSWTYVGAITTSAGLVRGIKNRRGNGFAVAHHPEDDQGQYHAEIHRRAGENAIIKSEKAELLLMLTEVFGPLDHCVCI